MNRVYINIITMLPYNCYVEKDGCYNDKEFVFYENSVEDRVWDVVIVYEGVLNERKIRVKTGGLWFVSGEPPMSREYPSSFLNMFDLIITSHKYHRIKNVVNWQQALDWHFCKNFKTKKNKYDLETLKNQPLPQKNKLISVVSSSKTMMPGHRYRQEIISNLKRDFGSQIDFFGGNDGSVDYKCDVIMPYKFHVCIENSNLDDYWTEKLADSLLGYSVPIYSGCTNIERYFDTTGMYQFNTKKYNDLKKIIESILLSPEDSYNKKKEALIRNREKLFTNYHLFKTTQMFYDKNVSNFQINDRVVILKRMSCYSGYLFERNKIRLMRFLIGIYINSRFW